MVYIIFIILFTTPRRWREPPICRRRRLQSNHISLKEEFPRVSLVIQRRIALLMYCKFADKLNVASCGIKKEFYSAYTKPWKLLYPTIRLVLGKVCSLIHRAFYNFNHVISLIIMTMDYYAGFGAHTTT